MMLLALLLKPQLFTSGYSSATSASAMLFTSETREHGGRDLVDLLVGALGGQHDRHQRLVGVGEMQFGLGLGIETVKLGED